MYAFITYSTLFEDILCKLPSIIVLYKEFSSFILWKVFSKKVVNMICAWFSKIPSNSAFRNSIAQASWSPTKLNEPVYDQMKKSYSWTIFRYKLTLYYVFVVEMKICKWHSEISEHCPHSVNKSTKWCRSPGFCSIEITVIRNTSAICNFDSEIQDNMR